MLKHIVLLKLKSGVTADQTADLLNALVDLMEGGSVPGILSVTGGYNNSPEGKSHGYDYGFVMEFEDAAARDRYLPHPDHQELGRRFVAPICDDVMVFDFELSD